MRGDQLEAMAERLGAPVVKALLGKGALPDNSPFSVGGIGLLGTKPAQEALEECDTLLIVGSCFPYIEFYPKPGRRRNVCRSTSTRNASGSDIRLTSASSEIAPASLARCCRRCSPSRTGLSSRRRRTG